MCVGTTAGHFQKVHSQCNRKSAVVQKYLKSMSGEGSSGVGNKCCKDCKVSIFFFPPKEVYL